MKGVRCLVSAWLRFTWSFNRTNSRRDTDQYFGWRSIFYFTLIPQIPALVLLFTQIKGEVNTGKMEPYDIPGSILYAITLFPSSTGSHATGSHGHMDNSFRDHSLIAFIFWESRIESPLFNLHHLPETGFLRSQASPNYYSIAPCFRSLHFEPLFAVRQRARTAGCRFCAFSAAGYAGNLFASCRENFRLYSTSCPCNRGDCYSTFRPFFY